MNQQRQFASFIEVGLIIKGKRVNATGYFSVAGNHPMRLASVVCALLVGCYFFVQLYHWSPIAKETSVPQTLERFEYTQIHMGMPVTLTVWASDRSLAESACKSAFKRVNQLEKIFSDYDSASEVSRVNRSPIGRPVAISDELASVIEFSQQLYRQSDAAFDPGAGRAVQFWREARKTRELPNSELIRNALLAGGINQLQLERSTRDSNGRDLAKVSRKKDIRLDFGGVAKGFIGDQVLRHLADMGITQASYSAGGDFVCSDPPPGKPGWSIEIPQRGTITLANAAVAVSGDTAQYVEVGGQRFSHVVDPRTGQGVRTRQMAVVIAPTGLMSDSLATTGCILKPAKFKKLLEHYPDAEGFSTTSQQE